MKTEPCYGWAITTTWRNYPEKRFVWSKMHRTRIPAIKEAVDFWHGGLLGKVSRANLWRRMKQEGFRCERVTLMTVEDYNALN